MTDQERNLTAAMNAHRFSEEVARQWKGYWQKSISAVN